MAVLTWIYFCDLPTLKKKLYDLQGLQNTHKIGDSPVSMKSPESEVQSWSLTMEKGPFVFSG